MFNSRYHSDCKPLNIEFKDEQSEEKDFERFRQQTVAVLRDMEDTCSTLVEEKAHDRVTISLFSVEKGKGIFDEGLFAQKANIAAMKKGLSVAAMRMGRKPPEFVLYILLVPDWSREGNSYKDKQYLETHKKFIDRVNTEFKDIGVRCEDFFHDIQITQAEKNYIEQMRANGNNVDIIKNRAIINNAGRRHLQIDSNTKIYSYDSFYRQTFGAKVQSDGMFACCYSGYYVSLQNKVAYTTADSVFVKALKQRYLNHCEKNQFNPSYKTSEKNIMYHKVFADAALESGLVKKCNTKGLNGGNWEFYPATMEGVQYRLTKEIFPAVVMSWRGEQKDDPIVDALKKIPEMMVGDAACDFNNFSYLINKYTLNFNQYHALAFEKDFDARGKLIQISDRNLDMFVIAGFLRHVHKVSSDQLSNLARVIPATKEGNLLMKELFEWTEAEERACEGELVKTFHGNPAGKIAQLKEMRLSDAKVKDYQEARMFKVVPPAVNFSERQREHKGSDKAGKFKLE